MHSTRDKIRLQWRHRGSDAYFDASALSDGTLRFMALSTLLLQPGELRPSVILLDEPELGLHPYAIAILSSIIKSVSVETQVLLATQSSILLDHFEPKDIVVAERLDGSTRLRRLDGQKLESWLCHYSLGQLWKRTNLVVDQRRSEEGHVSRLLVRGRDGGVLRQRSTGYPSGAMWIRECRGSLAGKRSRSHPSRRHTVAVRRDIIGHLREDKESIATMMVDYYGLPHGDALVNFGKRTNLGVDQRRSSGRPREPSIGSSAIDQK